MLLPVQVIPFLLLAIVFAIPAAAVSGRITSRFGVRRALLACLVFSVVTFSLFAALVQTMVT
jgi:MFS family permease